MPRSVLLIDDDPSVLSVLARFFDRTGWEVHQATSGEGGLRQWDSIRPDVVMVDLDLPGMSGQQVLEILVARGATVIMLTAHAQVATAVEAMQAGAETFLTKPVDLDHVLAAAERAAEKQELRRTNEILARQLAGGELGPGSLGSSPGMAALGRQVDLLARSADTTALLLGESGTGKSWVAQMIHARSPRSRAPFVEINCAGLSATFLDSELFGHEKGAFTDAREMKRGLFEVADRGTLFLDEIGDLAVELQPKLLRVLETRTFRRLGSTREIKVDVRLLAATNKDLRAEVRAGRFREDLYYRLSVFPLTIPPLRERSREDILELIHRFLSDLSDRHPSSPRRLSSRATEALASYAWPGNVRELRNVLERALVLAVGAERVEVEHLPESVRSRRGSRASGGNPELPSLADLERRHIERVLYVLNGNRSAAAETLGVSRSTLHAKISQYGLEAVGRGG